MKKSIRCQKLLRASRHQHVSLAPPKYKTLTAHSIICLLYGKKSESTATSTSTELTYTEVPFIHSVPFFFCSLNDDANIQLRSISIRNGIGIYIQSPKIKRNLFFVQKLLQKFYLSVINVRAFVLIEGNICVYIDFWFHIRVCVVQPINQQRKGKYFSTLKREEN